MRVFGKIKTTFSNMSLLKKLTLMYSVLILVPAVAVGYLSYRQTVGNLENEIRKSTAQTLLQVKNNVDSKTAVAENIVDKIAYSSEIQYFLAKDFELTPEQFSVYFENIRPLVSEAANLNQINVHRLSVFTNNDSIPEGWALFFNCRRIDGSAWYKSFLLDSSLSQVWLAPHKESDNFPGVLNDENKVFTLVKKIYLANSRYLGVVTLDVLESEMFSSLDHGVTGGETILATDGGGKVLYASQEVDSRTEEAVLTANKNGKSGNFIHGNTLYVYDSADSSDVCLVIKVPMESMLRNAQAAGRNIILVIFACFALLTVFTYFIIRLVFGKLNKIVRVMNGVAHGDFSKRISIDGSDEVGQLAGDFNILIEKINTLMQENIRKETAQKDAQLMALQYQINPHFIYNIIDVFRMKMELAGDYETAGAITDFGKMLRYNINSQSKYATLADELENVRKYVRLQKLRYGGRVGFVANVSGAAEELMVVKFILQPIVENSIRHGMTPGKSTLEIVIDFSLEGDTAVVVVQDNGGGIDTVRLESLNNALKSSECQEEAGVSERGIGLVNINDRMKLFYGSSNHIVVESVLGEFTRTILRFPQKKLG